MKDQEEQISLEPIPSRPEGNALEQPLPILERIYHRLHRYSGIWYMMVSNLMFVLCMFAVKFVPADIFDIMIIRFLIQSISFGSFASFYKGYKLFDTNGQPVACSMNIIMASMTNLFYLGAYYFVPLADLNIIKYTYIIWAAILAVLFLKDRFRLINAVTLILTLLGVLLTANPNWLARTFNQIPDLTLNSTNNSTSLLTSFNNHSPYYYLGLTFASLSSLTRAILVIARKQLVKTKQPYSVMNFHLTTSSLVISLIFSFARRFWQSDPIPWKWVLLAGTVFGTSQLVSNTFFAKALKRENVQLLSILGSLDIIYAVILEYIFLHQRKPWIFFVGAALVVLSATILSIDRHFNQESEKEKKSTSPVEENNNNDEKL